MQEQLSYSARVVKGMPFLQKLNQATKCLMPLILSKRKKTKFCRRNLYAMSALPIIFPTSGDNSTGDLSYVHSRDLNQAQLSLQKISLNCFIQCWNKRSHGQIKSHWLCGSQLRFASLVRQVCEAARGLTLLLTMQENCSKTAFYQLSICLPLQINEPRSLRMKPS